MKLKELIKTLEKYEKDGYSFHLGNAESDIQNFHFGSYSEVVNLNLEAIKIKK